MGIQTIIKQILQLPLEQRFFVLEQTVKSIKEDELKQNKQSDVLSPSNPGDVLSNTDFINWIAKAEKSNTISLQKAKGAWSQKRKQLQQLFK